MSRIYVNTRHLEERRIVIVEQDNLVGFEQDITGWENKKGDIYKAVVTRIEEGLDAAFVNFGESKNGFLPLKHIASNLPGASGGEHKIAEGDSILVQIKKDHVGDKGAGLTTNISLAGCYLVLMPGHSQKTLVTKNIGGRERQQMVDLLEQLKVPEGMGVIVRTAGIGRSLEDLRWDLESYLLRLWEAIETAAKTNRGPILIYRENNLMLRAVRDYFTPGEDEIYCDDAESYQELKSFVSLISPDHADCVFYHDNDSPMVPDLIEQQIDTIYERGVKTSSGGRVVFDATEAMVTVDVNSAQMRGHSDIEATALRANLEAAEIITRHMRLRDLGGLIVVDFIDMNVDKNRQKLEEYFVKLLRKDRARVQWTPLSRFGLMEISRQRLSRPVEESQSVVCHACHGTGRRRRPESFALRLLRQVRTHLQGQNVGALVAQVPTDTAIYLLNEKRVELRRLEDEYECEILIAPAADMYPPDFNMRKIKKDSEINVSYEAATEDNKNQAEGMRRRFEKKQISAPTAVIKTVMPEERAAESVVGKIWKSLTGLWRSSSAADSEDKPKNAHRRGGKFRHNRHRRRSPANVQSAHSPAAESPPAVAAESPEKKKRNSSRRRPIRRNKATAGQAAESPPAGSHETAKTPSTETAKTETAVTETTPTAAAPKTAANQTHTAEISEKAAPSTVSDVVQSQSQSPEAVQAADNAEDINRAAENLKVEMAKTDKGAEVISDAKNAAGDFAKSDTTKSLLSRLATQHNKSENEVQAALSALGCDMDTATGAHLTITPDIEERLAAYFCPPIVAAEEDGLIMVETAADIKDEKKTHKETHISGEVRVLAEAEVVARSLPAESATMKQVETAAEEKS